MNKKIKELAEQAGFSFKYKTASDELNPGHKLQDLEKFAELIVRECGVALNPPVQNRNVISRGQAYDLIKKHFGVKE